MKTGKKLAKSGIDENGTVTIPAGEFKAQCLALMEKVRREHISYLVTKRGKPVARLVPVGDEPADVLGYMGDTITVRGDIIAPIDVEWKADSAEDDA